MRLPDFPIVDFSGGVVRNKSDYVMSRNEVKHALNVEFDEYGKVKRRRGYYQLGTGVASTPDNLILFKTVTDFSALVFPRALTIGRQISDASLYNLASTKLNATLETGDTEMTVVHSGDLAASGTVEIDGDLIAYTGKTGVTVLTGVTGIRVRHPVGAVVNQWGSAIASGLDTRDGAYMAIMQTAGTATLNACVIGGRAGGAAALSGTRADLITITAIADADEQTGLFHTVYRDRVHSVGSGIATSPINAYANRVAYSDVGDFTAWTLTNFFDVEDTSGEIVTGLKVLNDVLWIFKPNSIFSWNESELKQRVSGAGAYNHRVIQEIDGVLYTFCPAGVFATTGYQAVKISDPIDEYLKDFAVWFGDVANSTRVISTCFAGTFDKKYILYIGDITRPIDQRTVTTDVVLVYDTIRKNWTVWNGFTDFTFFASGNNLWVTTSLNVRTPDSRQVLLGGGPTGLIFRMFENTITDQAGVFFGGDVYPDRIENNAGKAIDAQVETPLYDIQTPQITKKFGRIFVMVEQGDWETYYKLETKEQFAKKPGHESDWRMLGTVNAKNATLNFPAKTEGSRIALKFRNFQKDGPAVLSGFILRDIETVTQ